MRFLEMKMRIIVAELMGLTADTVSEAYSVSGTCYK